jgi:hypothetical protein
MRLNASLAIVVLAGALLISPLAIANDTETQSLTEIREQQLALRQDVLDKQGRFKDMGERERQELVAKQTRLINLAEGRDSLAMLSPADQVETINTLEWIKATITRAEDERLVCQRTKVVGSNRSTRVCRTVAELRRDRAEAEKSLEERKMCGVACRDN